MIVNWNASVLYTVNQLSLCAIYFREFHYQRKFMKVYLHKLISWTILEQLNSKIFSFNFKSVKLSFREQILK